MPKKLTYEAVYEEIKKRIKNGVWKPGDKIPRIEDLSKELNVGISSVREAIRILGKQKILKIEQGRGTFVQNDLSNSPSEQIDFLGKATFLQLAEARLIIEPELAALAAQKGTTKELRAIVNVAEKMKRKLQNNEDFLKEDMDFHFMIADISKNEILTQMIYMISDLLVDSRRKSMKWKGMDERAASYHLLIAHALLQRNPTQAHHLMKCHINDLIFELKKEKN